MQEQENGKPESSPGVERIVVGYRYRFVDTQEDIDLCLSCTAPVCKHGLCERYRAKPRIKERPLNPPKARAAAETE